MIGSPTAGPSPWLSTAIPAAETRPAKPAVPTCLATGSRPGCGSTCQPTSATFCSMSDSWTVSIPSCLTKSWLATTPGTGCRRCRNSTVLSNLSPSKAPLPQCCIRCCAGTARNGASGKRRNGFIQSTTGPHWRSNVVVRWSRRYDTPRKPAIQSCLVACSSTPEASSSGHSGVSSRLKSSRRS